MKILIAAALSAASLAVPAHASTIVVGTGTGNNAFPFSQGATAPAPTQQYQQVYNAASFAGPVNILSVSFQRAVGGTTLAGGVYTLSASTTSAGVNGLNLTNLAANIGSNNQSVFSGTLQPNFVGNILRFVFAAPYRYNPAQGNLLLNFAVTGHTAAPTRVGFLADNGTAGTVYSRAQTFGVQSEQANNGYGLVTSFDTSAIGAVPEPATWAMMILGFGLVGGAMRSARRQTVRAAFG